jgi:hypothetical protein
MKKIYLLPALLIIALIFLLFSNDELKLVFLTWDHEDTSHTMTVNYLTDNDYQTTLVYYDTKPHLGDKSKYRHLAYGSQRKYPGIKFTVHSTRLENLNPDDTYYFIVGDKASGFSKERKFRTVPESGKIQFIEGGDAGVSDKFEAMSEIAAETEPYFAVIGGDIAYVNGEIKKQNDWKKFLDIWTRTMITPRGFTIPIIAAIGNHETNKSKWRQIDKAPFYFMLFMPNGGKTYFARKIGMSNILLVLDTDHIYKSHGDQLDWMKGQFSKYSDSTFRFASYHAPLYPTYRDPDAKSTANLRRHWLPVFDQTNLHVAFEHHEHTLKKTKRLRQNKISENQGTYYLGDGNWGIESRKPKEHWYLEAARPVNHVWSVTLEGNTAAFKVLTINGVDEDYSFRINSDGTPVTEPLSSD